MSSAKLKDAMSVEEYLEYESLHNEAQAVYMLRRLRLKVSHDEAMEKVDFFSSIRSKTRSDKRINEKREGDELPKTLLGCPIVWDENAPTINSTVIKFDEPNAFGEVFTKDTKCEFESVYVNAKYEHGWQRDEDGIIFLADTAMLDEEQWQLLLDYQRGSNTSIGTLPHVREDDKSD